MYSSESYIRGEFQGAATFVPIKIQRISFLYTTSLDGEALCTLIPRYSGFSHISRLISFCLLILILPNLTLFPSYLKKSLAFLHEQI